MIKNVNELTRIYQPWDMETFAEYVDRITEVRDRMKSKNDVNFTVGGEFNGFLVVMDRETTRIEIHNQYIQYCAAN